MKKKLKVLIACEYSGVVRYAFLRRGHDAISCDLLPTDSDGPHYQGNVIDLLGNNYDLLIAHPPCTRLCNSGVKDRSKIRSRTFEGIADAMADQWGYFLTHK